MAKYMINIHYGDLQKRQESDRELIMKKYFEWTQKMGSKIVVAHKLKDTGGRRLEMSQGRVQDGPFVESKEGIGGFYVVETSTMEEALILAKECPTLLFQGGYVEVREVEM